MGRPTDRGRIYILIKENKHLGHKDIADILKIDCGKVIIICEELENQGLIGSNWRMETYGQRR